MKRQLTLECGGLPPPLRSTGRASCGWGFRSRGAERVARGILPFTNLACRFYGRGFDPYSVLGLTFVWKGGRCACRRPAALQGRLVARRSKGCAIVLVLALSWDRLSACLHRTFSAVCRSSQCKTVTTRTRHRAFRTPTFWTGTASAVPNRAPRSAPRMWKGGASAPPKSGRGAAYIYVARIASVFDAVRARR
jgi:hypothetical protein